MAVSPDRPSFLEELRRRKVVRAGSVYAAVAFATVEAADLVFPRLLLPDWSVTLVIALALAGMPLTVAVAWIYDLKAGVLVRSKSGPDAAVDGHPGWLSLPALLVIGLMVSLGAAAGWLAGRASSPSADRSAPASIAVLPFADMSPAGDMEYFGDGMAEEILNVLAQVPGLRVAGRTSSFSFKGQSNDLRSIGATLGVGTILEGSVRRSDTRIRITAQLVRTDDQSHVWSDTFDRDFDEDVFAVQDDIAAAIVDALKIELTGGDAPSIAVQRGTESLQAYNAYLRGRFQWNRRTREGVLGSIASFEEAIRLDPGYARAFTGMADAYAIASNFAWMTPGEAMPRARAAVDSALALNPRLADAYTSLGAILSWYEWDQDEAQRAYRRALELDPNSTFAHYWYAMSLDYANRPDDALAELNAALALDPLALQVRNGLGNHYQWRGDLDAAIETYESILEIDPGFHNARRWLATAYLEAGRPEEALSMVDSLPEGYTNVSGLRGWAFSQLGRVEASRSQFERLPADGRSVDVAYAAMGLGLSGEVDAAFELLHAAVDSRTYPSLALVFIPPTSPIRLDPRFAELVSDLNLRQYWP